MDCDDFGHDDDIAGRVGGAQGAEIMGKLVAQNKDKPYHGTAAL